MRTRFTILGLSMLVASIASQQHSLAEQIDPKPERIGVYDSRAIAIAYAGSPAHANLLKRLTEDHLAAKKNGDADKIAQLQAKGKALQKKAHTQAFSTAPVDDLLVHIAKSLPEIKKASGVSFLISKWNHTELKKHTGAERIDVTMKLVDAFEPNKRQRKSALEIQKQKPIPLEQAKKIQD